MYLCYGGTPNLVSNYSRESPPPPPTPTPQYRISLITKVKIGTGSAQVTLFMYCHKFASASIKLHHIFSTAEINLSTIV